MSIRNDMICMNTFTEVVIDHDVFNAVNLYSVSGFIFRRKSSLPLSPGWPTEVGTRHRW